MATVLELDPEQVEHKADQIPGPNDHSPASPLDLHPAAMRAACDLLDRLYQNGFLDLSRALASSGGDLAAKLAEGADSGRVIRGIRNGMTLLSLLGKIEPGMLQKIANPQPKRQNEEREPSLWALFKRFSSRDSRRGLALIAGAVESAGRAARESENQPQLRSGA